MKATRKESDVEYIVYTGDNIEEVETFLNGKCSFKLVHEIVWDTIEQAKFSLKHNLIEFNTSNTIRKSFFTKEGNVLLSANIEYYNERCYSVIESTIKVEKTDPFKEPLPELYVKGEFVPLGFYIVYDSLVGTLVLTEHSFLKHFN